MKIIIDAKASDVEDLERAGLLSKATVLVRQSVKRRRLSGPNTSVLLVKLDELRAYKAIHGTFDVPVTGPYSDLGQWLDKLKESYVKRPDGYRIDYLREHATDVLSFLSEWASTKTSRTTVRNSPVWLNAAWVADFMGTKLNAPSQASIHPDEVAMAKWLSRWSGQSQMRKIKTTVGAEFIRASLDDLARRLRSRNPSEVASAREQLLTWRTGPIYHAIADLCKKDASWMTRQRRPTFEQQILDNDVFWPTWLEWKRISACWVKKARNVTA